jgi:hypothetical protein
MKISAFKTDTGRAETGDWIEIEAIPGMAFQVRGRQTIAAKALRATLTAAIPVPDRSNREEMIRHQERIEREVTLSCLKNWRGIEDDDGKPLAHSNELAREMLLNPDFQSLTDIVGGACNQVHERIVTAKVEAIKN